MKAIVIDKKHLTLVSHTNGVTIIEESGCIIDLDFQSLGSIFELADLGNTYTINEQYGFDSSGYNIINSINSKFVISFKDRSIASRAFIVVLILAVL